MKNTNNHKDDWSRMLLGEDVLAMVLDFLAMYLQITIVPTRNYLAVQLKKNESQVSIQALVGPCQLDS